MRPAYRRDTPIADACSNSRQKGHGTTLAAIPRAPRRTPFQEVREHQSLQDMGPEASANEHQPSRLIDQIQATVPKADEDLKPLLEESLRRVLVQRGITRP